MALVLKKKPAGVISKPVQSRGGLNIQNSSGQVSIYHTAWVVIGPPGIGKSTLFSGFEDVLFLCTSEKEVNCLQVPYICITSWPQMLEVTDELINNRASYPYKFIAIDFIDSVWTMCEIAVCQKLGVQHKTDAAYGKGTDTIDGYFRKWLTTLIASDYGLMMVSHVNQKDVIVQGGTVTKTICTLAPRARMIVFPLVNVIGCIEYRTDWVLNEKTQKKESKRQRVIMFEGTDYVEAKDRDGCLPAEIILKRDPKLNYQTFKAHYDGTRPK